MAGEPDYVVLKNAVPQELCSKLEGDFNQASIKRKGIKFSKYRIPMSAGDVTNHLFKTSFRTSLASLLPENVPLPEHPTSHLGRFNETAPTRSTFQAGDDQILLFIAVTPLSPQNGLHIFGDKESVLSLDPGDAIAWRYDY